MQSWLSKNIAGLTLAAPIILVMFIIFSLIVSVKSLTSARLTDNSAELALLSNAAISEIQKERGLSAGFIGSKGSQFQAELESQRKKVDVAVKSIQTSAFSNSVPKSSIYLMPTLQKYSSELKVLRSKVDNMDMTVNDAVGRYTLFTTALLEFNGRLVSSSQNALGKQKFMLLYKLANLQESAGLERALLSNVFASLDINDAQRSKFSGLVSSQDSLMEDLIILSTPEFGEFIESFKKGDEQRKINTYRTQITNFPAKAFSIGADEWFSEATKRIEKLSELRSQLFEQLLVHADEESSAAVGVVVLDIVLLVLTLAIALASYLVLQLRRKQSTELQNKLKNISRELDLSLTVEKISQDDLGEVTFLINQLISQFKEDLALFQTAAHEISAASQQATVSSETTASNVRKQQLSLSSSLMSIESINVGIDADIESTVQLNTYANKSTVLVKNGEKRVSDAVAGIRGTASEVQKVGETIEQLNLRVEDILKMVDVIRSVAEQTNLLALNAAIEAARAGEQGRGFAVVADEVRALAKRTQDSTQEIARVVDELNDSSNKAFTAIAIGAEKASDSVNLADQINTVLTDVADNMIELEQLSENVNQSAQQQGLSLKQLADAMRDMDSGSIENSASAEQVAAAAHQLSAVATGMLQNVNKYKV